MTDLTISDLTQATLEGTGIFDTLMRANKAHLEAEFSKGRIKGTEYATVYLGSLEAVMRTSLEFLVQREQIKLISQQITNLTLQATNIPKEGLILEGQKCKLDAEYDLLLNENLKTGAEITLLTQKVVTEKAQTTAIGIDDNSVVGKQKLLYAAQTKGFARNAEQQAAQIMVDTWKVQRTTATETPANADNGLDDPSIKRAVDKLLGGLDL